MTETSLTTARYLAYTGSQISLFGIVAGVALLLSGIGFLILALGGVGGRRITVAITAIGSLFGARESRRHRG